MNLGILESSGIGSVDTSIPNTYIGGIAAEYPSASSVAALLGISLQNISFFNVNGLDLELFIDIEYNLPSSAFNNNNKITYFKDKHKKIKALEANCFAVTVNLKVIELEGVDRLEGGALTFSSISEFYFPLVNIVNGFSVFKNSQVLIRAIYIPGLTNKLGASLSDDQIFNNSTISKIYVNPALQTINSGNPDSDLTYASGRGTQIVYIQNYDKPSPVTNLSIGTIYATALQLNFASPSSVNAIQYYECYANGVYKNNITVSGGYITGLTPGTLYTITIKAIDIYYNKSEFSNSIDTTTSASVFGPMLSYFKMEDNVLDSLGTNNGTAFNISYVAGLVNKAASFNGTSSYISLGAAPNLNVADNFSISLVFKNTTDSSYRDLIRKAVIVSGNYKGWDLIKMNDNKIRFEALKNTTTVKSISSNLAIVSNSTNIIVISIINKTARMYLNKVLQNDVKTGVEITPAVGVNCQIGGGPAAFYNNGTEDEVALWPFGLVQSEVDALTDRLLLGQSLI